jgi:hypothetical protein
MISHFIAWSKGDTPSLSGISGSRSGSCASWRISLLLLVFAAWYSTKQPLWSHWFTRVFQLERKRSMILFLLGFRPSYAMVARISTLFPAESSWLTLMCLWSKRICIAMGPSYITAGWSAVYPQSSRVSILSRGSFRRILKISYCWFRGVSGLEVGLSNSDHLY